MKHLLLLVCIMALIMPVLADTLIIGEYANITITGDTCANCTTVGDTIICNICPESCPSCNFGYYNMSVLIHEEPYIPWEIWQFVALIGIALLVISIFLKPEYGNDIIGILAVLPLSWASWGALQIVFIHSGVFGATDPITTNQTNVFMLSQYDVYHEAGLALIFLGFTIIALINLYRILVLNRTSDKEVTPPPMNN